jgi:hypothetical protein
MGGLTELGGVSKHGGKAITLNYDVIEDLPGDKCFYCLSDKQVMMLTAMMEYIGWRTRWYSPENRVIVQDVIDGWKADLGTVLMTTDNCNDIITRITDIENNIITIDADITTINSTLDVVINNTVIDITVVNNQSDYYQLQVVINFIAAGSPGVPDKSFAEKGGVVYMTDRYRLWCALVESCVRFIKSVCYRLIAGDLPTDSSLPGLLTDLLTAGGVVLGAIYNGGIAGLLDLIPGLSNADIIAACEDTAAQATVACNMAVYLFDATVTAQNFYDAPAAATYTAASNEEIVQGILAAAAAVDLMQYNYQAFLATLATAALKQQANTPTSWDCGDGCTPQVNATGQTWDFQANQRSGLWILTVGEMMLTGDVIGIRSVCKYVSSSVGTSGVIDLLLELPTPTNLNGMHLDVVVYPTAEACGSGGNRQFNITWANDSGGVCGSYNSPTPVNISTTNYADQTITYNFGAAAGSVCKIRLYAMSMKFVWYVKSITLY